MNEKSVSNSNSNYNCYKISIQTAKYSLSIFKKEKNIPIHCEMRVSTIYCMIQACYFPLLCTIYVMLAKNARRKKRVSERAQSMYDCIRKCFCVCMMLIFLSEMNGKWNARAIIDIVIHLSKQFQILIQISCKVYELLSCRKDWIFFRTNTLLFEIIHCYVFLKLPI